MDKVISPNTRYSYVSLAVGIDLQVVATVIICLLGVVQGQSSQQAQGYSSNTPYNQGQGYIQGQTYSQGQSQGYSQGQGYGQGQSGPSNQGQGWTNGYNNNNNPGYYGGNSGWHCPQGNSCSYQEVGWGNDGHYYFNVDSNRGYWTGNCWGCGQWTCTTCNSQWPLCPSCQYYEQRVNACVEVYNGCGIVPAPFCGACAYWDWHLSTCVTADGCGGGSGYPGRKLLKTSNTIVNMMSDTMTT
eukprot:jgi/Botrbrau1/2925/Bobra.0026s0002.1